MNGLPNLRTKAQESGLRELCRQVLTLTDARRVVEIGSCLGDSAAIFLDYFAEVYCVDTWDGDQMNTVRQVIPWELTDKQTEDAFDAVMAKARGRICKVKRTSPGAAGNFPDNYFDLVYIDGAHDYDSVVADVRGWKHKTRMFMGGHDFCDTGGVFPAVTEELGMPHWIFEDSSWLTNMDWQK